MTRCPSACLLAFSHQSLAGLLEFDPESETFDFVHTTREVNNQKVFQNLAFSRLPIRRFQLTSLLVMTTPIVSGDVYAAAIEGLLSTGVLRHFEHRGRIDEVRQEQLERIAFALHLSPALSVFELGVCRGAVEQELTDQPLVDAILDHPNFTNAWRWGFDILSGPVIFSAKTTVLEPEGVRFWRQIGRTTAWRPEQRLPHWILTFTNPFVWAFDTPHTAWNLTSWFGGGLQITRTEVDFQAVQVVQQIRG